MIKIKNCISILVLLVVVFCIYLNKDNIYTEIKSISNAKKEVVIKEGNAYKKDYDFLYVKQMKSYTPRNKKDLINIFYSVLNQGWEKFTFYCPSTYKTCIADVEEISDNEILLSNINNYVSPFNSFSTIKTLYDDTGVVTLVVTTQYTKEETKKLEKDIDKIITSLELDSLSEEEKIQKIHDYIIDNTRYDTEKIENKTSIYDSSRIQGVLYDHYAICSGYSDTMAVFLDKLNIPNYKISSETHVWNAVYLNGSWLHLDLTWDDPVTTSGKDILSHEYFLITDNELLLKHESSKDHQFDYNIYLEFK